MRIIEGIVILDNELWLPNPETRRSDGLVAIGADLWPERMLLGYRTGLFAWSVNPVTWWSPDPRAIFEVGSFHLSRRLARTIRQGKFYVTFDRAFRQVLGGCAEPRPDQSGTWLTEEFEEAYLQLFLSGYAHSVECWLDGRLVGGVFGISINGFFAGESMFHRVSDASKVALYFLCEHLRSSGYRLFDIQVLTNHTMSLGAVEISRKNYLQRLQTALQVQPKNCWAEGADRYILPQM